MRLAQPIAHPAGGSKGKGREMPFFDSDGVKIHYEVFGEGEPVLLLHGFASNGRVNWVSTSWTKTLTEAAQRLAAHLADGHGALPALVGRAVEALGRYGLRAKEERLLARLAESGAVEASDLSEEELEAAIKLCKMRLIRCTLKL